MRRAGILVVLTLPILGLASGPAVARPARDTTVNCGTVKVRPYGATRSYLYSVRIENGRPGCTWAESAMRAFLVAGVSPRGWFCARGHSSQHQVWAVACADAAGRQITAFVPQPA